MLERLPLMGARPYLLRSLSAARLIYLFRGFDLSFDRQLLKPFNDLFIEALSILRNLYVSHAGKTQAYRFYRRPKEGYVSQAQFSLRAW